MPFDKENLNLNETHRQKKKMVTTRGKWFAKDKLGVWDYQIQTIFYKIDK